MRTRYLLLLLVPALAWSCTEDPVGTVRNPCIPFLQAYSAVNGDTLSTPQGVRYIDINIGGGSPAVLGNHALVDYSGYLTDGTGFDTSCDPAGRSLAFQLGDQELMPGFQYGVIGMRIAGVRRILVPPELGFQGDSVPRIIDVNLLNVLN